MKSIPTIIQQIAVPILGAAMPLIAQGHIPTDWKGWATLFASAVIASGLLNTTAPRNQAALAVPVTTTKEK